MNNISIRDLLKLKNPNILDIRTSNLYNKDHIPGSVNISVNNLTSNPSLYLKDNQNYYIYCEFGYKSKRICKVLSKLGYNVINVDGGYDEYINFIK